MLVLKAPRRGISRIELLILVLMALLVGCLSIVYIATRARPDSDRAECAHNLRQIGQGCHAFADAVGVLPTEAEGQSVFVQLSYAFPGPPSRLKLYLCPMRRRPGSQPLGDYGYGTGPGQAGTSVLAAPKGLSLKEIDQADGTAYTLLLSHKAVNSDQYDGSGRNDTGWHTLDHARDPGPMYLDCPHADKDLSRFMGAPHPGSCPSLWCDGHVSNLAYSTTTMPQFWAYDDGR
jgi:prepilin-type processing-associated H-X9-DG protein